MIRLKSFIRMSLLGGLVVILPIALLAITFTWMLNFIRKFINPIANLILNIIEITGLRFPSYMKELFADIIAILVILIICFIVGVIVRTKVGKYIHKQVEKKILARFPLYNLFRETILQFFGTKRMPFSKVAVANIYGNETMVTAFITDEHDNGMVTVFVPTGPNPTSGNIYHLKEEFVHLVDAPVEDTMRSIISCGAGSKNILSKTIE